MKTVITTILTFLLLAVWGLVYIIMIYPSDIASMLNEDLSYEVYDWLSTNLYMVNNLFLLLTAILLIVFYIFGYNDGRKKKNDSENITA